MVNPFLDYFSEIVTLDSRNYVDDSVVSIHGTVEAVGKQQNHDFPKAVIEERMQQNHATIKKNSFALFKKQQPKVKSMQNQNTLLQNNVSLFGQQYVSPRNRNGDLQEFFSHQTQGYPAFLSDYGKLQACKKSDLLHCIGSQDEVNSPTDFYCKYCEYCGTLAQLIGRLL